MSSRVVGLMVNGELVSFDLDAELEIANPEAERHKVAADMAWWGIIAAAAEAHVEKLTASAEQWYKSGLVECLKADEKMAEWKAKANVGASPTYLAQLHAVADAREVANKATAIHWAFVRKMDMLRDMLPAEYAGRSRSSDVGRTQAADSKPDPRFNKFKANRKLAPQEDT